MAEYLNIKTNTLDKLVPTQNAMPFIIDETKGLNTGYAMFNNTPGILYSFYKDTLNGDSQHYKEESYNKRDYISYFSLEEYMLCNVNNTSTNSFSFTKEITAYLSNSSSRSFKIQYYIIDDSEQWSPLEIELGTAIPTFKFRNCNITLNNSKSGGTDSPIATQDYVLSKIPNLSLVNL